ncbi:hypothetical protein [Streptomyces alboniger]|uniref:Uncharacterized protein n=1 Tax=Streptomyces alboniger TaxID=132473 RepID=A0A5J6HNT9_STRAD|nr:hypothetical protein [Streptomyces alboniger]QEV21969.1 hypothetical protein CP975_34685 [Streptomyces alboniger]
MGRKRIGIVSAIDDGNDAALRYLILHLNTLQSGFEFEFLSPDPTDPLIRMLTRGELLDREVVRTECEAFRQGMRRRFMALSSAFRTKEEEPPDRLVLLTKATLADNFYSLRHSGVSIIALGNWQRWMAPPSILEFVLTLTVREAIAAVSPRLRGSVHLGTKGCVGDVTPVLSDVRQKVMSSYLCGYCRRALEEDGVSNLIPDVEMMLSKSWIGTADDSSSPAGVVSALGHDLFIVKGLEPTAWEHVRSTLRRDGTQQLLTLLQTTLAAVLIAGLIVALGLK